MHKIFTSHGLEQKKENDYNETHEVGGDVYMDIEKVVDDGGGLYETSKMSRIPLRKQSREVFLEILKQHKYMKV